MKLPKLLMLSVISFLIFNIGNISSQWSADTLGMGKKEVIRLIIFGNTMITGTNGSGIYVRESFSDKWTKVPNSPQKITGLVVSGNNLVAGTFDGGVSYSTDKGSNWIPSLINTKSIITIFENKEYLLAGTNKGIYKSTDNGITWSETSMKTPTYSIAIIGNNFYAGTNRGLKISTSLTGAWTTIFNKTANSIIPIKNTVLIANNDGTIYKKNDNGDWIKVASFGRDIYKLSNISNIIFACIYLKGIKCSIDYGDNRQDSCLDQNPFLKTAIVWDVFLSGTKLYACTGGGIYTTELKLCIEP